MEKQLVYAELTDGITGSMLGDALVQIISDGGIFIVTTKENSLNYPLDFYPVGAEGILSYGLEYREGRVVQNYQK